MGAGYDRKAAMDYARSYWDRPCKDGLVYTFQSPINTKTMKPPGPSFVLKFVPYKDVERLVWTDGSSDVVVHEWAGLADCAHFISSCLTAGGAGIQTNWVPNFPGLLKSKGVKALAEKATEARAKEVISTGIMQAGDMICYFDFVGREIKNTYMHSAMFTSNDTITCHTKCRFDSGWNLHPDFYLYSLYHFPVDDNKRVLLKPLAPALKGWWRIRWRGQDFYYLFSENGSVSWSFKKPGAKGGMLNPEGTGYWFGNPGTNTFFICWTKSGSVERFTLDLSGGMSGTWNENSQKEEISGSRL